MTLPRLKGSRRVQELRDGDYDHEISIVDDECEQPGVSPRYSIAHSSAYQDARGSIPDFVRSSTQQALFVHAPEQEGDGSTEEEPSSHPGPLEHQNNQHVDVTEEQHNSQLVSQMRHDPRQGFLPSSSDSAVDLLFENERGCFLCGLSLFSSTALGPLDRPPWTNAYDKLSPTDTKTAQPPDPSWAWAWPSWTVHDGDSSDPDGWTYSFAYGRYFSWHRPHWWNSFVRRRAWLRKRVKVAIRIDAAIDPFSVQPVSEPVFVSSRPVSLIGDTTAIVEPAVPGDITDMHAVLAVSRRSRIDRETIEAVKALLEYSSSSVGNGTELTDLAAEMPKLMSHLVFQASRELLLACLTRAGEEAIRGLRDDKVPSREGLLVRRQALEEAAQRGEEEMKRMALWTETPSSPP